MKFRTVKAAQLREMVAAAFDDSGRCGTAPQEVPRLATQSIAHL